MRLSNLHFINCTRIDHRDLSFDTFDEAITLDNGSQDENYFTYDTFKFTTNSLAKQSTASSTENMKTLKLFIKETNFMKQVKRNMRHILNQGVKHRLTQNVVVDTK